MIDSSRYELFRPDQAAQCTELRCHGIGTKPVLVDPGLTAVLRDYVGRRGGLDVPDVMLNAVGLIDDGQV